ncbi:hypothetical protein C5613_34670 [Rhodococcus opacus]|uniref:RES domain-containing protein n=1 Tax=Rhodococcus opacus TaxID=37919 RepID=A0A2S8IRD8_RHOOP|nr:hypothetical protein C5613_34670 [Rhodococcus opacus]
MLVNRELRVADATSNAAIQFGMTSEISTTTDYALTQQWAQALRAAGFDGIRYWARHEKTPRACRATTPSDLAGPKTQSMRTKQPWPPTTTPPESPNPTSRPTPPSNS